MLFKVKNCNFVSLFEFQVHKIIGFSPILLQAIMSDQLDMPVRQAGKFP